MAVSHQWFLQWSAPAPYFTDISSEFTKLGPDWNIPDVNYNNKYVQQKPYELPIIKKGRFKTQAHVPTYRKPKFEREKPQINGK